MIGRRSRRSTSARRSWSRPSSSSCVVVARRPDPLDDPDRAGGPRGRLLHPADPRPRAVPVPVRRRRGDPRRGLVRWRIAYMVLSLDDVPEHVRRPHDALPGQPGHPGLARDRRRGPRHAGRDRVVALAGAGRRRLGLRPAPAPARSRALERRDRRGAARRLDDESSTTRPRRPSRRRAATPAARPRRRSPSGGAVSAPRWPAVAARRRAAQRGAVATRRTRRRGHARPGPSRRPSPSSGPSAGSAPARPAARSGRIARAELDDEPRRPARQARRVDPRRPRRLDPRASGCSGSSEPYQMHFDEVYHARTATEFLQDWRYGDRRTTSTNGPIRTSPSTRWPAGSSPGATTRSPRRANLGVPGGRRGDRAALRRPGTLGGDTGGDRVDVVTGSELRSYDLVTRGADRDASRSPGAAAIAMDDDGRPAVRRRLDDGTIWTIDATALDTVTAWAAPRSRSPVESARSTARSAASSSRRPAARSLVDDRDDRVIDARRGPPARSRHRPAQGRGRARARRHGSGSSDAPPDAVADPKAAASALASIRRRRGDVRGRGCGSGGDITIGRRDLQRATSGRRSRTRSRRARSRG